MEIKITKTIEETKTINLPLFFVSKDGKEFIGFFSDADLRKILNYSKAYVMLNKTCFTNYDHSDLNNWLNPEKFTEISEQEFISTWDNALRSLSFNSIPDAIPY